MAVISQRWEEIGENNPRDITLKDKVKAIGIVTLIVGGTSSAVIYANLAITNNNEAKERRITAIEEDVNVNDGFTGADFIRDNTINLSLGSCTLLGVDIVTEGDSSDTTVESYSYPASDSLELRFRNKDELQELLGGEPCAKLAQNITD